MKTIAICMLVTSILIVCAFFFGVSYGKGIPATKPPSSGEEKIAITVTTKSGKKVEISIYEVGPPDEIFVYASVVP